MYSCDLLNKECNNIREPVCLRGSRFNATSVTGTGPGMACKPDPDEPEEPTPPRKLGCRINVKGQGKRSHSVSSGNMNIKVC